MLKMEIDRLAAIMEGLASDQEKVQGTATPTMKGSIVRDPVPSKTKGRERATKRMSHRDGRLPVVITKAVDTIFKHVR